MLLHLHHRNSKLFFHPAEFDKFKDKTISESKTVSVSQSKNWWSSGIMIGGQFLFLIFEKIFKKLHKMKFKNIVIVF